MLLFTWVAHITLLVLSIFCSTIKDFSEKAKKLSLLQLSQAIEIKEHLPLHLYV